MDGWLSTRTKNREELRRITASNEFSDLLRDLVRQELEHERRAGLALEDELARAVAVAVRGSVEIILPLLPEDDSVESRPFS